MAFVAATPFHAHASKKRTTSDSSRSEELDKIKKRKGIYRCSVWGCAQVAEVEQKEEAKPKKLCPKCKKETEAPYYRMAVQDYRCKACLNKIQMKNHRDRERKQRAKLKGEIDLVRQ